MKVFAHRGASGEFPENTLLAFEQAIIQKCDGIELDVQYHHSGEFILLHDRFVQTNSGETVHFNSLSLEEIFAIKLPRQQKIPSLKQALSLISGRCSVNIELKSADDDAAEIENVALKLQSDIQHAVNHDHFVLSDFLISAFNHSVLSPIQEKLPSLQLAALIVSTPFHHHTIETLSISALNPDMDYLNESLVNTAHFNKLQVNVFTVDHPDDILQCIRWGVDAIFTNYPLKSRQFINNYIGLHN